MAKTWRATAAVRPLEWHEVAKAFMPLQACVAGEHGRCSGLELILRVQDHFAVIAISAEEGSRKHVQIIKTIM